MTKFFKRIFYRAGDPNVPDTQVLKLFELPTVIRLTLGPDGRVARQ